MNAYLSGNGCSNGYLGRRSYGQWGYGSVASAAGRATRRQLLWTLGGAAALAAGAPAAPPEVDPQVVARNDAAVERLLRAQITDPSHPQAGRRAR